MPLHCQVNELEPMARAVIKRLGVLAGGRRIAIQGSASRVLAYCDADVTMRILQNLLVNAIKFTPPEGEIRIEFALDDQEVRMSVIDSGPGIPIEFHEKVFLKFGQVEARKDGKMPSTGLGLTFCKLASEAQGGTIQLENAPSHGAAFHVRLPRVPPRCGQPLLANGRD
jgi:two-component system, sensor histidine kinase and response regulator